MPTQDAPTSSSPRSAARSATSSPCPSSRPHVRSATIWVATTVPPRLLVPYLAPSGELKTADPAFCGRRPAAGRHPARRPRPARRPEIPDPIKRKIALCDVDTEGTVAAAVDAPSIYDIPKGAPRVGTGRLCHPPAGPDLPRCRLDRVGHAPATSTTRRTRSRSRSSASTSTARRLPVGDRGAAGRRLPPRRQGSRSAGSPRTPATPEAGATKALGGVDAVPCPAASGSAGSRARSAPSGGPRGAASPTLASAWACSAWSSVGAPCRRHRGAKLDRGFDHDTPCAGHRATMEEQKAFDRGCRRPPHDITRARLGSQRPNCFEGSVIAEAHGATTVTEQAPPSLRSFNDAYRGRLEDAWSSAGHTPVGTRRVRRELPREVPPLLRRRRPIPESGSRPSTWAHPLFAGLTGAAIESQRASRLVEVERPHVAAEATA